MDEAQKIEQESINVSNDNKPKPQKLSLYEMEKELLKTNSFIVINNLVYHYDEKAHHYKLVDQDDVISLYRRCVDLELHGASSLSKYKDLYKIIQTDPDLRRNTVRYKHTYCALRNAIYFIDDQGELEPIKHTHEAITFTCIKASYSKEKDCPVFRKFIDDIIGEDCEDHEKHENREKVKNRLLMALGYLLVDTQKGKFFFLAGFQPDSGKSVLFNFIQRLFPPEAVSNLPIGDLGGRFESESLLTSRINISLDLPQEPLSASAVSKIKQLTGGDTVEVQRKNKTSKKIDHPVKLVFAANHPICLKKDDKAFWNRLIFLPFMNTVKEEEKDPELGNKLWAERHAIVTLLLHYAQELERMNYEFPPISEDKLKGYVQKSNEDYILDFIQERCEIGTNEDFCSVAAIWKEFKNYQQKNPGPYCTHTEFNKFMECHGFYRVHKSDVRGFLGIKVKERPINILEDVDWKALSKTDEAKKLAKLAEKFLNEDE